MSVKTAKPKPGKVARRKIPKARRPSPPRHPALRFIHDVTYGRIPTCKWVRLCVERHLRDLKEGHKRGLRFIEEAAQHHLDVVGHFRQSKGKEWAGQPLRLAPFQAFIHWCVYGWMRADGTRRFRRVYQEIPRKNGKSTELAANCIYALDFDGEPGGEIYSVATKRKQAAIVHTEACRMVQQTPELAGRVKIIPSQYNMHVPETFSQFEALGRDKSTMDGLNVHFGAVDEFHEHKSSEVFDKLDQGTGARDEPLIWIITVAGSDWETICGDFNDYTKEILEGHIEDDAWFGIIFTIDEGDDWRDPKCWPKANPALGVFKKQSDIQDKLSLALKSARQAAAFKRYQLCVWTESESPWIRPEDWDACAEPLPDLEGMECVGGLDLSQTFDLTALVLAFRIETGEESNIVDIAKYLNAETSEDFNPEMESMNLNYNVALLPFFWIPESKLKDRSDRQRNLPWQGWVDEKHIRVTPGDVIDYNFIFMDMALHILPRFQVTGIAYDRWAATEIVQKLEDKFGHMAKEQFMIPHGQGYASMSRPSKFFETAVAGHRIIHGGNPVLRWNVLNATVLEDPAGNIKPAKPKRHSPKLIDGAVAAVEACTLLIDSPDPAAPAQISFW